VILSRSRGNYRKAGSGIDVILLFFVDYHFNFVFFYLLFRLDKLRLELHKFQGYLDEAEGRVSTLNPPSTRTSSIGINGSSGGLGLKKLIGSKGSNNILPQHGGSDESLSRSASDSSVSNPNAKPSLPGTPQQTHG